MHLELDGLDIEAADGVDRAKSGTDRPISIVFMRSGVAEIYQYAVAHILGDKPVEASDDFGNGTVISGNDLAQVLGVEPRRQGRRADEVAEHHGQLPPLGGVLRLRTGRCGGRRRCLGGGQIGDGSEETSVELVICAGAAGSLAPEL